MESESSLQETCSFCESPWIALRGCHYLDVKLLPFDCRWFFFTYISALPDFTRRRVVLLLRVELDLLDCF